MNYNDFYELELGDLVVVNRGRFKSRLFEVEYIDYDNEIAHCVWSYVNEAIAPDPLPVMDFRPYSIEGIE